MKDKSLYEIEISILADEFFALPKDDASVSAVRNTVKEKLFIVLWKYYTQVQYKACESNGEKICEVYSGIIGITIASCMENYKYNTHYNFLHYVNAAVKNEISRERQRNYLQGIKVPQKIKRLWHDLSNLATSKQIPLDDRKNIFAIGVMLGKNEAEIQQAIDYGMMTITSNIMHVNGKEIDVFDTITSNALVPEEIFERQEANIKHIEQFKFIDAVFSKKQDRVKKYLSALLTLELYKALLLVFETQGKEEKFSFIDKTLFNELHVKELHREKLPTQQEIARRFSKDKTDASRALNNFLAEVKKYAEKLSTL